MRQIFLSQRYLRASTRSEGSMIPPRRRSTKWSVDSARGTALSAITVRRERSVVVQAGEIVQLSRR